MHLIDDEDPRYLIGEKKGMNKILTKAPAEQRDIFRPKQFYNYINLRLKNSQCTMKKSSKKKALIHLSPFIRQHLIYCFCNSCPFFECSALCDLPREEKLFEDNFRNTFSQNLCFEVFCKGNKFPES